MREKTLTGFFEPLTVLPLPENKRAEIETIMDKYKRINRMAKERGIRLRDLLSLTTLRTLARLFKRKELGLKRLTFVGAVGTGKTTAISASLGLVYPKKLKNGAVKVKTVLPTGKGRTTLGDTIISQSGSSVFEVRIEPFEAEELEEIINDFVQFMRTYVGESNEDYDIPLEFINAFNRLLGLKSKARKEEKVKVYRKILKGKTDREVAEELKRIIAFEERVKPKERSFEAEWKKDTSRYAVFDEIASFLADINRGLPHEGVVYPFPKRLYIGIPKELVDLKGWEIVDTKGLESDVDSGELSFVRRIYEKMSNPENFLVFCSAFVDAPSKYILTLLDSYRDMKGRKALEELSKRSLILILAKGGELIDDEEEDVAERKIFEVQEKLSRGGFPEIKQMVYNSIGGELARDVELATPREYFWQELGKAVEDYQNFLIDLLDRESRWIESELDRIEEIVKNPEKSLFLKRVAQLLREISQYSQEVVDRLVAKETLEELLKIYMEDITKSFSASTLRALNRFIPTRRGVYRDLDVYYQLFFYYFHLLFRRRAGRVIDEKFAALKEKVLFKEDSKVLEILLGQAQERVHDIIHRAFKMAADRVKDYMRSPAKDDFWMAVNSEWGKGAGYTQRVISHWHDEVDNLRKVYLLSLKQNLKEIENIRLISLYEEVENA